VEENDESSFKLEDKKETENSLKLDDEEAGGDSINFYPNIENKECSNIWDRQIDESGTVVVSSSGEESDEDFAVVKNESITSLRVKRKRF